MTIQLPQRRLFTAGNSAFAGMLSVACFAPVMLASCGATRSERDIVVMVDPGCIGCDLAELVGHMSGSFASTAQSERDPEFLDIRLHMTPIWPQHSTPTAKWLYVEQAMATALDKPYRQRIYRVSEAGRTPQGQATFVSEVYEFENPLGFAGAYASPKAFDSLTPEQLTRRDGCEVLLTRLMPGVYEGGTQGTNCLSSLRGATYASSKVHIDSTGLLTWDQGFDKQGKQVWGAIKGGYEFKRQPPSP